MTYNESTGPAPEHRTPEWSFEKLSEVLDGIVMQESIRHYNASTQEHQFTSRLAELIEQKLNGLTINGMTVNVKVQEFHHADRLRRPRWRNRQH